MSPPPRSAVNLDEAPTRTTWAHNFPFLPKLFRNAVAARLLRSTHKPFVCRWIAHW